MLRWWLLLCVLLSTLPGTVAAENRLETPRGYYRQLEFLYHGQRLSFGPFVGYFFKPQNGDDLSRLDVLSYNERQFYTDQLPADSLLFKGEAILATLAEVRAIPPAAQRITPIFFEQAPPQWLQERPAPQEAFLHFHSAYDRNGAVYTGYWLRHQPVSSFTYNMGGRVGKDSPLYHQAKPGAPQRFPRIIEFDAGPRSNR
jgi:hypothetical protein